MNRYELAGKNQHSSNRSDATQVRMPQDSQRQGLHRIAPFNSIYTVSTRNLHRHSARSYSRKACCRSMSDVIIACSGA